MIESNKRRIERQIENVLVAQAMMIDIPDEGLVPHLSAWRCGSAMCVGGWCTMHPHFRAQGVRVAVRGTR